jgi:hypothetical protein
MEDNELLCFLQSAFVTSVLKLGIFFSAGFCHGRPLSSTCSSARIFKTLWLIRCSPEILVSQAPVAAM